MRSIQVAWNQPRIRTLGRALRHAGICLRHRAQCVPESAGGRCCRRRARRSPLPTAKAATGSGSPSRGSMSCRSISRRRHWQRRRRWRASAASPCAPCRRTSSRGTGRAPNSTWWSGFSSSSWGHRSARASLRASARRSSRAGFCCCEGYGPKQLEYKTGGPSELENLYTEELLRAEFAGFSASSTSRSYDSMMSEGIRHVGMAAVVDLVGRK